MNDWHRHRSRRDDCRSRRLLPLLREEQRMFLCLLMQEILCLTAAMSTVAIVVLLLLLMLLVLLMVVSGSNLIRSLARHSFLFECLLDHGGERFHVKLRLQVVIVLLRLTGDLLLVLTVTAILMTAADGRLWALLLNFDNIRRLLRVVVR